jgi:hypothetical protein
VENNSSSDGTTKYMTGKTQLITYIHKRDGGFHVYEHSFINTDTLKLKYVYGLVPAIMGTPLVWIYKRLK